MLLIRKLIYQAICQDKIPCESKANPDMKTREHTHLHTFTCCNRCTICHFHATFLSFSFVVHVDIDYISGLIDVAEEVAFIGTHRVDKAAVCTLLIFVVGCIIVGVIVRIRRGICVAKKTTTSSVRPYMLRYSVRIMVIILIKKESHSEIQTKQNKSIYIHYLLRPRHLHLLWWLFSLCAPLSSLHCSAWLSFASTPICTYIQVGK